jgi:hypothetical protein
VSAASRPEGGADEIVCPHCKMSFHADLLEGAAERA